MDDKTLTAILEQADDAAKGWETNRKGTTENGHRYVRHDIVLAAMRKVAEQKDATAWLIEWPADDNLPVRWWHPQGGWMMDAAKAIRFARKEDGEAYAASSIGLTGHPVTEHMFLNKVLSTPEQLAATARFMDDWAL